MATKFCILVVFLVLQAASGKKNRRSVSGTELSKLMSYLWNNDWNAAVSDTDYTLDLQGRIYDYDNKKDLAPNDLFSTMQEYRVLEVATYKAFYKLLDNYIPTTGKYDSLTSTERNEVNNFLNEIMKTSVMKKTHDFLKMKGLITGTVSDFKKKLWEYWFTPYSRKAGVLDSSGFEHVFVGEINKGAVSGFHNWVQFYRLEDKKTLDYKGYLRQKQPGQLNLRLSWNNYWKLNSGMFIGTSPEFEIAAYTICFLVRPNGTCNFKINGKSAAIKTYRVSWIKSKKVVASAYPIV